MATDNLALPEVTMEDPPAGAVQIMALTLAIDAVVRQSRARTMTINTSGQSFVRTPITLGNPFPDDGRVPVVVVSCDSAKWVGAAQNVRFDGFDLVLRAVDGQPGQDDVDASWLATLPPQ
jgi:hypothetical protein